MKLTILVDNTTYMSNLLAEDAFCAYIEDNGCKILLDTGESDLFLKNAQHLGIDLGQLDYIVLSHGHHDHVWGLKHLLAKYPTDFTPQLIMHPVGLLRKTVDSRDIGFDLPLSTLKSLNPNFSTQPVWFSDKLVYLGEIPRVLPHEGKYSIGHVHDNGNTTPDYMLEDTAIVYKANDGLVIITGCSHSGIGNIIEYAKKLCAQDNVLAVIGGLHLKNPAPELLTGTKEYLKSCNIKDLFACHCTDQNSRIALAELGNLRPTTVGMSLEFI